MKTVISAAVILFLAVTSSYAQKTNKTPKKPKQNTCQSVAQYDYQTDPAVTRQLHADVPAGGKLISKGYKVRLKDGDAFVDCIPGKCLDKGVDVSQISQGSNDVDGALVFDATVSPQIVEGFSSASTVRLIVTYSTSASPCISESTFAGYQSRAEFQYVYIPMGASIAGWGDFFHKLDANNYTQCDDSTGIPNNHEVCRRDGGVEFHPDNANKSDLERGMKFTCSDSSGSELRCRGQIRYSQ